MKFYKQIVLILAFLTFSYADVPKGTSKSADSSKNKMVDNYFSFETRDIVAYIANNGLIADYHPSGDSALKFKEISSVFQSSVWVGGIVNGDQRIILGDYTQDMGPGPYGSDPLSNENKIYYVEVDMMGSPEQYDDFQHWPTDQGAPYVDADGDGVYTPLPSGTDYPKFIGDKVAFFTTNDGDPAYKLNMGTSPLNLEFHFLIYSFDQPVDVNLANSLFYKVKVINKGGDNIEGTYFGVWQDDDLGHLGDDLVGVDVGRSLSYTWNDGPDPNMPQNEQFVKGSDFLQGPMVDCISDGAVNITLLGSDEDGDQLEYVIATEPSNGTLTCNAESCTYYPDVNFIGKDTFTYFVQEFGNSANKSDEATVTINVVESGSMNGQNVRIDETAPVVSTKFGGTLPSPNHKALIKAMENVDLHSHQHDDGYVRCLTDELEQQLQIVDPGFIAQRDNFYDIVEKNKASLDASKISTVNIPVIFHVLYFDDDDNISNAQITENFNQINDDFRLENADADKIPKTANRAEASDDPGIDYNHFYSRGSHDVRFVGFDGETKGTSLNEVTTIRRYKINQETVSGVSEASTLAGSTAPDDGATGGYQEGYLNIYIAPLSGGLLGQAYLGFPEAVVMGSTVGSLTSPGTAGGYNRGRTLTHEIGHNFSFNHIFNSSNCDDVLWSDIPPQITNNRTAQVYEDTLDTYTDFNWFREDVAQESDTYLSYLTMGAKTISGVTYAGSRGERVLGNKNMFLATGTGAMAHNYISDSDEVDRLLKINSSYDFSVPLSSDSTYYSDENLSQNKVYHLRISGTGKLDGENVDPVFSLDSLNSMDLIKLDNILVSPYQVIINNKNYYDYFFIGKNAQLAIELNTSSFSTKEGSFAFFLYEVNDMSNSWAKSISSGYYDDDVRTTADSTFTVAMSSRKNYFRHSSSFAFDNQGTDESDTYYWNNASMYQGEVQQYRDNGNGNIDLKWSYSTEIDSTFYNNPCGNGATSGVGQWVVDLVQKVQGQNVAYNGDIIALIEEISRENCEAEETRSNYLFTFNSIGTILEEKEISSHSQNFRMTQLIESSNGDGYFLVYKLNEGQQTNVMKLKPSLDMSDFYWDIDISADGFANVNSIQDLKNDNGIIITGNTYDTNNNTRNYKIGRYESSSGNKLWINSDFEDTGAFVALETTTNSDEVSPPTSTLLAFVPYTEGSYTALDIQRLQLNDGIALGSSERPARQGNFSDLGFRPTGYNVVPLLSGATYYLIGSTTATSDTQYLSDQRKGAVYRIRAREFTSTVQYAGRYAENSCIGSSGKGDQFMNYMDYVYDDQMRMFSDEQSNDGYSWAYSYDWYATGNSLPVAYDITMTASIDDDCAGAKMFGSYHPNKKNLPASSFAFYVNGDATYTDPSDETEGYNYLQGLRKDGSAYPNDIAGDLYDQKFVFYGDPNSPNGHSTSNPIDGNYAAAADRRSLMSVGPFTMAPGDSQEIVFNILHAEGGSSLEALANLLTASDSVQTYYNNDFSILAETNEERAISISAAQTTGTAPHTITFSLNSTYQFPVYNWDFNGDGITDSASLNPTYTFNDPGEYTVTATAKYRYYEDGMFNMKPVTDSISVTILDNYSAITITADSLVTNEDTSLSSALTISNPSNRAYELQLGLTPSNGVVSFNNATMNYTPNKNFNGLDSLKVFAKDGAYESSEALIQINVLPVDDTPVTGDVAVSTNEDTAVTVYLTASEYDGDTYEFEIKEHPAYGSLSSILSSAGVDSVIYTPDTDWFGTDQFKFEASDSSSRMNLGTAVIQVLPVNDAPLTEDVTIDTYEDVTTPITLSFSDVDNDEISITLTAPTNGSVELNGSYAEYVPNSNYYGTDSFNYYVSDGTEQSNVSNVSVNIEAVNDASSDFSIGDTYIVDSTAGEEWVVTTNSLIATKENEEDSLQFNWNESFDIDGDKIQYRMIGYNDLEFLTMDDWITDLTLSWSIKDLVANTDTVNVANGSWMIVASDGEFFVESNFGNPMELLINGSALIPDQYSLNQNYPNPFKNFTTISFDMPENQKVKIRIFDVRGRMIRTLINEDQSAGFKSILWDGKNEDGDEVSAGVYFYQMYAPSSANFKGITKTKRMVKFD
jgi:PKD repeat protein